MPWSSINDIANSSLEKKGIKSQIQESLVLQKANELIRDFFGSEFQDKARAIYFKDSILTIAVLSDDLYNMMQNQQDELVAILNSKFSANIVSTLKFLN